MPYTATISLTDEEAALLDRWRGHQPGVPSRRVALVLAIRHQIAPGTFDSKAAVQVQNDGLRESLRHNRLIAAAEVLRPKIKGHRRISAIGSELKKK